MSSDVPERVDFRGTIATLRRGWWIVLACMLLVGGMALAVSLTQTKQYSAYASLLFRDPAFDQKLFGTTFLSGSQDPDRQAATNVTLVGLRQVADRTARRQDVKISARRITKAVEVSADGRSDVVTVKATFADPTVAARVVNAFASEFIGFRREADRRTIFEAQRLVEDQIQSLKEQGDSAERANELRARGEQLYVLGSLQTGNAELVQRARAPDGPSSPRPKRNSAVGLFLGGLLGVGSVLLLARLDRRLRTFEGLEEAFGKPVLARVPVTKEFKVGIPYRHSRAEEAFGSLWTNMRYFNVSRRIERVLVTSAASGDGKSTVALNLAAAAARTGLRVLLLEADLRRPSLSGVLPDAPAVEGLTRVLTGTKSLDDVIFSTPVTRVSTMGGDDRELDVVLAGPIAPNPAEMLDSEPMRGVLQDVSQRYDLVVIDTPPTTVVPDAVPLLQQVSAVLVVARLGSTTRDEAAELKSQLDILDAPFVGVVANYAPEAGPGYYYGTLPEVLKERPAAKQA